MFRREPILNTLSRWTPCAGAGSVHRPRRRIQRNSYCQIHVPAQPFETWISFRKPNWGDYQMAV